MCQTDEMAFSCDIGIRVMQRQKLSRPTPAQVREEHGSAADSSSLQFRYICTVKESQEIIQIQTERYKGRYLLLKCMTFHTFISYILLGNIINYLLLIACRSRSHSRSLILQSDIVEARAHYPGLTTMFHMIDHHLTQQSEVVRRR